MDTERREAVSSLVDGELAQMPATRVVEQLIQDPQMRERWASYHLIGEVMRRNPEVAAGHEIAARVRSELAAEPTALRAAAARPAPRPRLWAGLALAASLAAVAVVTVRIGGTPADKPLTVAERHPVTAPNPLLTAGPTPSAAMSRLAVAQPGSSGRSAPRLLAPLVDPARQLAEFRWRNLPVQSNQRLNAYLVNHSGYLTGGMRGMLPYARIISYDTTR